MLDSLRKLFYTAALVALFVAHATAAAATGEAARVLTERFGDFVAVGTTSAPDLSGAGLKPEDFEISAAAARLYKSTTGEQLSVTVFQTSSNGAAYSLLTREAKTRGARVAAQGVDVGGAGRAAFVSQGTVAFVKGSAFVVVSSPTKAVAGDQLSALARAVEESIDAKPGEFPVLVQHLPRWEQTQADADFAVSLPVLQQAAGAHPVLDVLSFEGGTEAVAAKYGEARLVIVEFTTPQYAADNDARISERINQLREAGQLVPSFYKREGNYSVFVFDAADESAAAELAANVKYEKEVRWLGDNPNAQARAEQQYANTMGNVILTTLKTTGVAILLCLSIGGLFGGLIFLRRRAQASANEAYTDAGGMLRLNLEDAHPGGDAASRLVAKRKA